MKGFTEAGAIKYGAAFYKKTVQMEVIAENQQLIMSNYWKNL